MGSWTPRLPSSRSVLRQVSKTESQVDSNYRTADGPVLYRNIFNKQKSRSPRLDDAWNTSQESDVSQPESRELTWNISWSRYSNQLSGRTDCEGFLNRRGFEAMRILNSSWKRWRRKNTVDGDDHGFSPETTPDFKLFAFAKPLNVPNTNKEMKKTSCLSIMKPRAMKQVEKTWSTSEAEDVSAEPSDESVGTPDVPSDESTDTTDIKSDETLEKVPCILPGASSFSADRILRWFKANHQMQADLLTIINRTEGDGLSYDEFVQHLQDIGAPGCKEEMYNMAFALDTNQDHSINYQELKKLNRRFRASSFVKDNQFMTQRNESLPGLRPCSKCKIGLFEPTRTTKHRFISLLLKNFFIKGTQKNSLIGQFTFDVGPEISIYGIQRMVNAELGGSAIRVRILRGTRKVEVLDHMKTLEEYGYQGSMVRETPQVVELFYDYDYPKIDCPLLLANSSR